MAALGQTITLSAAREVSCAARAPAGRRINRPRLDLHARWLAIVLSTLMAFLGQSFLTQTHLHAASAISWAAGVPASPATLKASQSPPDLPVCPVCQEMTHAGTYLSAAVNACYSCELGPIWRIALPSLAQAPSQFSHAWRSRAPPGHAQA